MKRLTRSEKDKKLTGLCGGLAVYFDVDVAVVRLAVLTLVLLTGPFGLIAYIVGSAITPKEGEVKHAKA